MCECTYSNELYNCSGHYYCSMISVGQWAQNNCSLGPMGIMEPMGPMGPKRTDIGWMAGGRTAGGRRRTAGRRAEHRNINRNNNIDKYCKLNVRDMRYT